MSKKLKINYLPEIKAWFTGRKKPTLVSINLTEKCNQYCVYCEIGQRIGSDNQGKLSTSDVKWIIEQMSFHQIKRLALCGGEPFLFKDILELVKYAGVRNIQCWITSNGMTIHEYSDEELFVLKKYKSEVNISIDSFDEKVQSELRGTPDSISNALKSIEKLKTLQIPQTLLCAISRYNYTGLFDFVKFAYDLGIQQVLFQPIISYSNYPDRKSIEAKGQLNVQEKDLTTLMTELKRIHRFERNHKISTNIYRILPWIGAYIRNVNNNNGKWFFDDVLNKFYCRDIYAMIEINYNGFIQPCGLVGGFMNFKSNQDKDLIELWEDTTKEIKADLINENFRDSCNGCCNHFSRNMIASIMKYPIQNRHALFKLLFLLSDRVLSKSIKKVMNRK